MNAGPIRQGGAERAERLRVAGERSATGDLKPRAPERVKPGPFGTDGGFPMQCIAHEPLFDVHPQTGASIEVFYADRTLETFGRSGGGWFYWSRRRGSSPDGPATAPFATSEPAYRHAL